MRQGRPEACCKQQGCVARAADTCSRLGSNPSTATTFAGRCSPMIWLCPTGSVPATQHMTPETTPEQDKPEPFALDLNDDTPLPVICELSEDGTCEACQ